MADKTQEAVEKGMSNVKRSLERIIRKGTLNSDDAESTLARISTEASLEVP